MIVMDRVNALAPGWSHVLSTTNDLAELDAFRIRVGAPREAFHLRGRRPHLDLKLAPRERALLQPDVRVFERTSDLLRFLNELREGEQRLREEALKPRAGQGRSR
jgi:hypothetical protein